MVNQWTVLSDGAQPTEDIYFLASAAPVLEASGARVQRITASRSAPLAWWQQLRYGAELRGHHLIVCRSLPLHWIQWLERHRHRFVALTYLIDDDLGAAADDTSLPTAYRERMARVAALQPRLLALADRVVACSDQLAERLRLYHGNVQVLTPPLLAPLPSREHLVTGPGAESPWRLGFHGTRAHIGDLQHIAPALESLQTERDDTHLEIMLGAHTPANLAALPRTSTPKPLPWSEFQAYQQQQRVHIGLAPLWDSPFNRGKSFIKFLDIATMGGVGVFSRRYPYTEVVQHGVNGLLADDTPSAWAECLARLLDDPADAARMADQAAEDARRIGAFGKAVAIWQGRQ